MSHGFLSVHLVAASISLLSHGALPISYFPRLPLRPPCRHVAPSPRSSPQPISHTVSPPSSLSSLAHRALAASVTKRAPKHRRCFWEENREKKESKDVADIETRRTQKRFPYMSHCRVFGINFTSLIGAHVCGIIAFMEFVLTTRCQKLCIVMSLPPYATLPQLFPRLGPTFFRTIALIKIVPKNPCHPPSPRSSISLPPAELPPALPRYSF